MDDILRQYPFIGDDIQDAQKQLNHYMELQREARVTLKAQGLSGMPHGSDVADQTLDAVTKLCDLYQAEIDKCIAEINRLMDLKKWLDKAFSQLSDEEKRFINLRYDKGMYISKISYTMHMSRKTIYKFMDDTLDKVRRIIT